MTTDVGYAGGAHSPSPMRAIRPSEEPTLEPAFSDTLRSGVDGAEIAHAGMDGTLAHGPARDLAARGTADTPAGTPGLQLVEPLSAREREVVGLLASGLSTTEISGRLFVTAGTVRNHLKNIYGKLDAHSRLQAVERARALRLL